MRRPEGSANHGERAGSTRDDPGASANRGRLSTGAGGSHAGPSGTGLDPIVGSAVIDAITGTRASSARPQWRSPRSVSTFWRASVQEWVLALSARKTAAVNAMRGTEIAATLQAAALQAASGSRRWRPRAIQMPGRIASSASGTTPESDENVTVRSTPSVQCSVLRSRSPQGKRGLHDQAAAPTAAATAMNGRVSQRRVPRPVSRNRAASTAPATARIPINVPKCQGHFVGVAMKSTSATPSDEAGRLASGSSRARRRRRT